MNCCNCIGIGWKKCSNCINVIFEPSSIPNQSNSSGIHARLGIDLIAEKVGSKYASASLLNPTQIAKTKT